MPTKRKSIQLRKRSKQRPAAHLLIVECESVKLAHDGLAIGTDIKRLAEVFFPKKTVVLVQTSNTGELLKTFAEVSGRDSRFRSVIIVAHSNSRGLKLTSDRLCPWDVAGEWIARFSPEFLLLTACEAGQSLPAGKLFGTLKSLKAIYASPNKLYREQSYILLLILHQLLEPRSVDKELFAAAQAINFIATRGIFFKWTRREFKPGKEVAGRLWDLAAMLVNRPG
jgi:hypothetical protein